MNEYITMREYLQRTNQVNKDEEVIEEQEDLTLSDSFSSYLKEEKFDINKFISACKAQLAAFKKGDNKEGEKFLQGILDSYDKNGSLSPNQVKAASKFMKG